MTNDPAAPAAAPFPGRRAALRLLAGTAVALPAGAASAGHAGPEPLLGLDRACELFRARCGSRSREAARDARPDPEGGRWLAALGLIAATPARGYAGLAVKAKWLAREHDEGETVHRRGLRDGLLADLARLAGGGPPAVAPLAAAAGAGTLPDPHLAWRTEWKALLDWCDALGSTGGRPLAEFPQWDRLQEVEGLILATPAATLDGAGAQLRVATWWTLDVGDDASREGVENALATLDRLAGRARA